MNGPVEPGALVAVTGANGYLASYIVRDLLAAGYRVRGTVRDPQDREKTAHLLAFAGAADRLELVAGDLLSPGSFDAAMVGCAAVIHCAAAVFFSAKDPEAELLRPSVDGTLNVLRSAVQAGAVRRIVHTSSVAAVYHWDLSPGHVLSEADWNTTSTLDTDPYAKSKVEAERAAVAFVDKLPVAERPDLVHLNPGMIWGPPMIKAHTKASPSILRDIVSRNQPGMPRLMLNVVDVRDVSLAHVRALTLHAPPPRCLLSAGDHWLPEIAAMAQAAAPDVKMATMTVPKFVALLASRFDPALNTTQLRHLIGLPMPVDSALSRAAYGMQYRPVAETIKDTVLPMIEQGWARVKRR